MLKYSLTTTAANKQTDNETKYRFCSFSTRFTLTSRIDIAALRRSIYANVEILNLILRVRGKLLPT